MAKVTGPLMSMDARGKIGDAIVFIGWKGRKTVRMWLKPANPKTALQGNVRTILGGLGRACGFVKKEKDYHGQLVTLEKIPEDQSKQSYLVKYLKDQFMNGTGATMKTNYEAIITELQAHTAYADWQSKAEGIGMANFEMTYDDTETFEKALQLYVLAKGAIVLGFTGTPYTTAIASWTATEIQELIDDLIGV